jgi:uncharacterized protein (DUF2267 family)
MTQRNGIVHITSTYEELIALVQGAAKLASPAEAIAALRATLETLAEFEGHEHAARIAAHLPLEVRQYLLAPADGPVDRSIGEFFCRITLRENSDLLAAMKHGRSVLGVLTQIMPRHIVQSHLPPEFAAVFAAESYPGGAYDPHHV